MSATVPVQRTEALKQLCLRLHTQNNRITSYPIFEVQEKKRIYGTGEAGFGSDFVWIYFEDGMYLTEADGDTVEKLEELHDEACGLEFTVDGTLYTSVGYVDNWHNVMSFFTEEQADNYIRANAHNLGETRTYVASGYRNEEWKAIRHLLMNMVSPEEVRAFAESIRGERNDGHQSD